jgi:predicted membrane protein
MEFINFALMIITSFLTGYYKHTDSKLFMFIATILNFLVLINEVIPTSMIDNLALVVLNAFLLGWSTHYIANILFVSAAFLQFIVLYPYISPF